MPGDQSDELAVYIIRRGQLKAQLTKFQTYIEELDVDCGNNIIKLRLRLEKIKELWTEFDLIQNNIEIKDTGNVQLFYRDTFVDLYFDVVAKAETMVQGSNSVYSMNKVSVPGSYNDMQVGGPAIKMKPLEIPIFSGKFEEWSTFKDLFLTMVHYSEINSVQKFVYLRMHLSGDASSLIQNVVTTADNYSDAWNTVVERYDNKRILIQSYTKNIYELEPMQKESSVRLRKFTADLNMNMQALKALGHDPDAWGALLLHVILVKLDYNTIRNWESIAAKDTMPAVKELITFLNERCQILEAIDSSKNLAYKSNNMQLKQNNRNKNDTITQFNNNKKFNAFVTTNRLACYFCKEPHPIYKCQKFIALSASERTLKVDELNLCRNCLGMGRTDVKLCWSKKVCSKCKKMHNTLLHADVKQDVQNVSTSNVSNEEVVVSHAARVQTRAQVLLATAEVHIVNACGELVVCRALLDNGSQINILTEAMSQRLGLARTKINKSISGINEVVSRATYEVTASIKSRINNYSTTINMLELPKITGNLPTSNIDTTKWSIPKNIKLADSRYFKPEKIDLLIGADSYWEIMCTENFKLHTMGPYLQQTMFGWIIVGPVNERSSKNNTTACFVVGEGNYLNLEKDIEDFLEN